MPDYAFYGCTALTQIDLSKIVRFGSLSMLSVKLPAYLDLSSAEYIDVQAFVEADEEDAHFIETVFAPNLTFVGEQAFVGCSNLATVIAPKIEEIGLAAFAYTGIVEFEIPATLTKIASSAFEGCESLTAFYATVNEEKVYDASFKSVMVKDGVLYEIVPKGYVLISYPTAKTNTEFVVADGTVRIDYGAAHGNTFLEKVIMPGSLGYIGNYAFFKCENLKTVVFQSYYAPVLEGTMTGDAVEITKETLEDYPDYQKIYRYNYYLMKEGVASPSYLYSTFKGVVTSKDAVGLTYVIPANSKGYDSALYQAYFLASEEENAGTVMGPFAIAFINAVNKLPEKVDRFAVAVIEEAIGAYNALENKAEELKFVDESYITKYLAACSDYNVSVVENKINHLFDMYNSAHSFNAVKDAREAFLALSAEEQARITNGAVLDQKIADLKTAMGKELDFSLTYEDHFKADDGDDPVDPPVINPPAEGPDLIVIICIVAGGVLLVAAGVVVALVLLKKKKSTVPVAEASDAEETKED
jgi:hypothetical protein